MNRYTYYPSPGNVFYNPQPTDWSVSSSRHYEPVGAGLSKTNNSVNLVYNMVSNKYPSASRYKSSELPWTPTLASANRYPLAKSSTSYHLRADDYGRKSTIANLNGTSTTTTTDYHKPAGLRSTDASDRTTTYHRTTATSIKPTESKTTSYNGKTNDGDYCSTVALKAAQLDRRQQFTTKPESENSRVKHVPSTISSAFSMKNDRPAPGVYPEKPHRTTSLKLKSTYTSMIDQLASNTFAKLRLGSSSKKPSTFQAGQAKAPITTLGIANKQPSKPLKVLLDEPICEVDELVSQYCCSTTDNNKGKASPGSSTSGLSSFGASAASPTYSTASIQQNCVSAINNSKLVGKAVVSDDKHLSIGSNRASNMSSSQESGQIKTVLSIQSRDKQLGKYRPVASSGFYDNNTGDKVCRDNVYTHSYTSHKKLVEKEDDCDSQYIDSSTSSSSNTSSSSCEKKTNSLVNECELVLKSKTCPSLASNVKQQQVSTTTTTSVSNKANYQPESAVNKRQASTYNAIKQYGLGGGATGCDGLIDSEAAYDNGYACDSDEDDYDGVSSS